MQDTLHTVTFHFVGCWRHSARLSRSYKKSLKLKDNEINDKLLEKSEQYFIYVMVETFFCVLIRFCDSTELVSGAFRVSEGIRASYL